MKNYWLLLVMFSPWPTCILIMYILFTSPLFFLSKKLTVWPPTQFWHLHHPFLLQFTLFFTRQGLLPLFVCKVCGDAGGVARSAARCGRGRGVVRPKNREGSGRHYYRRCKGFQVGKPLRCRFFQPAPVWQHWLARVKGVGSKTSTFEAPMSQK